MNATASLPRLAGKGIALVTVTLDFTVALLGGIEKALSRAPVKSVPVAKRRLNEVSIWQLYRMTAGRDSVSYKVRDVLHERTPD